VFVRFRGRKGVDYVEILRIWSDIL
jgi:hypothetical protein